jgi:hypothetical protein
MAQVYGPLMSESARGQFGEIVIFQEYHGKTYAKGYGKPNWTTHPPTAAQLAVQAMNKSLMKAWPAIAAVDKATWDALAIPDRVSRVNSYLKENFKRLRSGLPATDFWPAIEAPPWTPDVLIVTGELDPDATGTFTEQPEEFQGFPYYKTDDNYWYIFRDSSQEQWVLSDALVDPMENYWLAGAEEGPDAIYEPQDTYTGYATVAFQP